MSQSDDDMPQPFFTGYTPGVAGASWSLPESSPPITKTPGTPGVVSPLSSMTDEIEHMRHVDMLTHWDRLYRFRTSRRQNYPVALGLLLLGAAVGYASSHAFLTIWVGGLALAGGIALWTGVRATDDDVESIGAICEALENKLEGWPPNEPMPLYEEMKRVIAARRLWNYNLRFVTIRRSPAAFKRALERQRQQAPQPPAPPGAVP